VSRRSVLQHRGPAEDARFKNLEVYVTETPTVQPVILPAPELGNLGAEAINKYAEAMAVHIEQVRDEILNVAKDLAEELTITAANVREIGKLEAERTVQATTRMREAFLGARELRDRFVNGPTKEAGKLAEIPDRFDNAGKPLGQGLDSAVRDDDP